MSKMINGEELLKRIDDIAKGPFINETSLLNDVRLAIIGEMQSPEPQPIMIDSEELLESIDKMRTMFGAISKGELLVIIAGLRQAAINGESKC